MTKTETHTTAAKIEVATQCGLPAGDRSVFQKDIGIGVDLVRIRELASAQANRFGRVLPLPSNDTLEPLALAA